MNRFVDVVIFKNIINLDQLFTYSTDNFIEVGQFVIVDFNNSLEIALVLKSYNFDKELNVKSILKVLDELPRLPKSHIELGLWMKEFYILTYAKAYGAICDFSRVTNLEIEYMPQELLPSEIENILLRLNSGNLVTNSERILFEDFLQNGSIKIQPKYNIICEKDEMYYGFCLDLKKARKKLRSNAIRQQNLLEVLFNEFEEDGYFSASDLFKIDAYEKSVFDSLLEKEIFKERNRPKSIGKNTISLSDKQKEVSDFIKKSADNKFLIRGITGSGKTEIYFSLIEDTLSKGKSAIFLVPEIGLTPQMEIRIRERFGDLVAVIHSKLSVKKRVTQIQKIENNEAKILLGTRSAVFQPMKELGLIIVDEEHDDSYKLNNHNKYDVREVARFLTENNKECKLVLGSATPSIESYYKAKNKVYNLSIIEERPFNVEMPKVIIVDMKEELAQGNTTPFSLEMMASMKESLNKNKQILLFLNRRGYYTSVMCRNCGHIEKCSNCDISMVYHKNRNLLKCHYCGNMRSSPRICPQCGSRNIKQFGMGTEKLEEETKLLFPDFNVIRIDSDTTNRAADYEKNVKLIMEEKVSIIIGTQMISKGLDFPNIDMVGVIAADLSLNIPNYNSAERTFQLMMQVAGRAGRGKETGKVVVQTYNPNHYAIIRAKEHDYESFFEDELLIRRTFAYPPFNRLYTITVINRDFNEGLGIAKDIFDLIDNDIKSMNLSKMASMISHRDKLSISRFNDRYHYKILLVSNIRHEKFIKNIIYDICINNKFKLDLSKTYIDITYS